MLPPVSFDPGEAMVVLTTVSVGFSLAGIVWDGAHIWVTDSSAGTLLKLNSSGAILQTVNLGPSSWPLYPAFDGANIWVPNLDGGSVSVVQASTGTVVATIAGNALNMLFDPYSVSFDGQRMLVTSFSGQALSVFKAADLSFITAFSIGNDAQGACNDGINFWVGLSLSGSLLRF